MITDMRRRIFLKGSLAAGAVSVAVGAGLLAPRVVLGAWSQEAFSAEKQQDALKALLGTDATTPSDKIMIKAPDIAENGAVVPITVESEIAGTDSIAILADANARPLTAVIRFHESAEAFVSTRIKMGKTGNVVAVASSGGNLHSAQKSVKVTIGGCGG